MTIPGNFQQEKETLPCVDGRANKSDYKAALTDIGELATGFMLPIETDKWTFEEEMTASDAHHTSPLTPRDGFESFHGEQSNALPHSPSIQESKK